MHQSIIAGALAAGLIFTAAAADVLPQTTEPVQTQSGALVGLVRGAVHTYFGIPYAAPPVGDLRWRAPPPPPAWHGVKDAFDSGPVCKQTANWVPPNRSEDCLTLNIWTPAKAAEKPYPVMVWIHGGAFHAGAGSLFGPAGGDSITRQGVILVGINYRLGVLGFFAHPELSAASPNHTSGNQGLLDQIAALKWVRQNIEAFGGDPGNVTIVGESAGAMSVAMLAASPLAQGLFQRAIVESGVLRPLPKKDAAEMMGTLFARANKASSPGDLRAMAADKLIKQPWRSTPNVDGYVFPDDPTAPDGVNRQSTVPFLVGWNADEGVDLAPEMLGTKDFTKAAYPALVRRLIGDAPPRLMQTYPAATDAEAQDSIERIVTDVIMGQSAWRWAGTHLRPGAAPAYLYYYVHSPVLPLKPGTYGRKAGHTAEIRFAFGQLHQDDHPWGEEDLKLQAQMVRYWTNFAKTGDPNGEGLPAWPRFDGTPDSVQRLGSDEEIKTRGAFPDFRQWPQ